MMRIFLSLLPVATLTAEALHYTARTQVECSTSASTLPEATWMRRILLSSLPVATLRVPLHPSEKLDALSRVWICGAEEQAPWWVRLVCIILY